MPINLYEHQKDAIGKLRSGSILVGGVGSGKSRTALTYYFTVEGGGTIIGGYAPMIKPKDLYIITTARKRDTHEWEQECIPFLMSTKKEENVGGVDLIIDSWNNIHKYSHVKQAFFIFDEQRLVGNGVWVKSFIKITKNNNWILLSATPGDTWMDYIPVFIANGFYKNRTEFIRRHVIYNNFSKFPKVDHFIEIKTLVKNRNDVIVNMHYERRTTAHEKSITVEFNRDAFNTVMIKRWNIYEERPVKDIGELCLVMRKVVNSDLSRIRAISELITKHPKVIIFYNFNYERDMLLKMGDDLQITTAQWNGHKHELIPNTDRWVYIVQYAAGAEGWNCIETNVVIFFSQNYSYKATIQAAGRIDRLNTPFDDLYYYYLRSNSLIDLAIKKALTSKKNFNEHRFISS